MKSRPYGSDWSACVCKSGISITPNASQSHKHLITASLQAKVERRQAGPGKTFLVIRICESAWANILSVVATSASVLEIQPQLAARTHLNLPTEFALVEVVSLARDSCTRDGGGSCTDGAHKVLVAGGHATANFAIAGELA